MKAGAFVKTAVGDVAEMARRARAFSTAHIWQRAAYEVEEAQVIQRKARDARERIRKTQRTAIAELAALRAKARSDELYADEREYYYIPDPESETAAIDRVDRIGAILAAADRHVATIEHTVAALRELDIPR